MSEIVLSVRDGASVAGRLKVLSGGTPTSERIVVLIHGYQVAPDKARKVYGEFRARAAQAAGARRHELGTTVEFHWPGSDPRGLISLATYPVRVGYARESGQMLAREWLKKRPPRQKVCLVAHSLGCRVALEAVRTIRHIDAEEGGWTGATIEGVFLLAAAVPVARCEPSETEWYDEPFRDAGEHVFHSEKDRALRFPFVRGQRLSGEWGVEAVGRSGLPGDRWTNDERTSLGHGEYWSSRLVAERTCEWLGLRPPSLASSSLPQASAHGEPRVLEALHSAARHLGLRRV